MKKTIIALLALGTGVMASDGWVMSTTPEYNGSQGGSYAGIAFTLGSNDTTRFTTTGEAVLSEQVELVSISLTERGGNDLAADRILYITDAKNVYLGSSAVYTKDAGTDVAVFDFGGAITLNTSDTYYAYMMNSAGDDAWVVGETTVSAGQYYSAQLAAAGGSLSSSAANWGLLNAQKGLASTAYAPVMSIVTTPAVAPAVPEPTTATLSLLALAGLAARRRRR